MFVFRLLSTGHSSAYMKVLLCSINNYRFNLQSTGPVANICKFADSVGLQQTLLQVIDGNLDLTKIQLKKQNTKNIISEAKAALDTTELHKPKF